jgi:AcrR family transcriptional regulator
LRCNYLLSRLLAVWKSDLPSRRPPASKALGGNAGEAAVHRDFDSDLRIVRQDMCLSHSLKCGKFQPTGRNGCSLPQKPKTRRRRSKAEQRAATIEKILDVAEYLFSKHGLYGVTLKDVAKRVDVHHSLLNYYFKDKKELFDAVFARRAHITSERRMKALDAYEAAAGNSPTVEGALRAFLDTDLDLYIEGGKSWQNYAALGAQVANTPEWGAKLMDQHFDPVVLRLIGLLNKALPDCAEEDIFWGYHFVSGALMLTLARTGRIDKLSGGRCKSDDFIAVKERMASFMAGGFIELCRQRRNARN